MIEFDAIGDGIHVARTQPFDVNASLVLGDSAALVVDTLSTASQATQLMNAIRGITTLPLIILNTHDHFDHTFGNAVLADGRSPVWAHPNTIAALRDRGAETQARAAADHRSADPEFAAAIEAVKIHYPDHPVRSPQRLDLGGRIVTIAYFGRAHTDGDVVALIPDADVILAGDLIEQGAPPAFGDDSYPLDWPEATTALLRATTAGTIIVPGHGATVDQAFVAEQHAQLAAFAWLIREAHADGATMEATAARAPWPATEVITGITRGFATLDDPV